MSWLSARSASLPGTVLAGAIAGLAATFAMNQIAGFIVPRRHPDYERHFHYVTFVEWIRSQVGTQRELTDEELWKLGRALHFSYGAAMGCVYFLASRRVDLPSMIKGPTFGVALWASAFCGFIPLMGIYKPAWRFDRAELEVTLAAHAGYGLIVGMASRFRDGS